MTDPDQGERSDTGVKTFAPVSPLRAGLLGRCPRCGEGPFFEGLLTIRPTCPVCDLDMRSADPGDGPAVFVILIMGALITISAILVELHIAPPAWVHVIWVTLFLISGSIWLLRVSKGILVALQFRYDAHEGHLDHQQGHTLDD